MYIILNLYNIEKIKLNDYKYTKQHKVFYQSIKTIKTFSQLFFLLEVVLKKQKMILNTPFFLYKDSFLYF
jgi:hypothetical protein